ncbi:glycosyltransferase family 4 protein, partial [Candidatus Uhrbacteria bacterium]|nr:glycosyltransferase family 4 protein [Candidatus Uhrbacteria bacterium]
MPNDLNLLTTQTTGLITYAIDASSANKQKRTGVENYARELIQALKNHPLKENERVILYSPTALDAGLRALPTGWTSQILRWPLTRGWMAGRVSWEMLRRRPSVLFVPGQALPRFAGVALTTIHDVAFARRPDLYDPAVARRLRRVTKRAVKKATRILTPSEATKQDFINLYHVAPDRLVVTPEALDTKVFHHYSPEDARATLQKFRLGANFFLTVGRLEKKKNLTTLIRAFELFKSRRGMGDPFELLLVGEPGFGYDEIKKYVDRSPYKESIRLLGYLPDEEVAPLMSAATAYLFPSWYEGFGIPNLEAMAARTVLVASDIRAHQEVVG